jgi:hypothetical protein
MRLRAPANAERQFCVRAGECERVADCECGSVQPAGFTCSFRGVPLPSMRVGVIAAVVTVALLAAGAVMLLAVDYEPSCAVVEGSQTIPPDQAERCGVIQNP